MMRRCGYHLIVLLVLVNANAAAGDDVYDWDGSAEASLGATTAGLFGLGYWANRSYQPLTRAEIEALDPDNLNALDRTAIDNWSPQNARVSDFLMGTSIVAPAALMLSEVGRDQADVIGVMYLETFLLNSGLTYAMKNIFGRKRPFVYGDHPDIPLQLKMSHTAQRSFPSGHTSTAFASFVFLASVHSRLNPGSAANSWVWGGCLAAAATTGYLRYTSGWHFPTDILMGAAIGGFAGWVVPRWHEWEEDVADPTGNQEPSGQTLVGLTLAF